jgi:hypothetical protein
VRKLFGMLTDCGERWSLVPWTPFERANRERMPLEDIHGVKPEFWNNSRYQVSLYRDPSGATHLSIKTHDRSYRHDWRDLQRIKNELCGPEREAIEIYPSESRLVDCANQYHLWVMPEGEQLPIGFKERLVSETTIDNAKQRPWDPADKPANMADAAAMVADLKQKAGGQQ